MRSQLIAQLEALEETSQSFPFDAENVIDHFNLSVNEPLIDEIVSDVNLPIRTRFAAFYTRLLCLRRDNDPAGYEEWFLANHSQFQQFAYTEVFRANCYRFRYPFDKNKLSECIKIFESFLERYDHIGVKRNLASAVLEYYENNFHDPNQASLNRRQINRTLKHIDDAIHFAPKHGKYYATKAKLLFFIRDIGWYPAIVDAVTHASNNDELNEYITLRETWKDIERKNADSSGNNIRYTFFLCHANEDKKDVVEPLAEALRKINCNVWYDQDMFDVDDNITKKTLQGLLASRHIIIFLSDHLLRKPRKSWSWKEVDQAMQMETATGSQKVIIPILVNLSKEEALSSFPEIMNLDRFYYQTDGTNLDMLAQQLKSLDYFKPS